MATTAERLAEVEAAISAILHGAQEYQIGAQRIRRAELSALLQERKHLTAILEGETGANTAVAYLGQR